MVSEVTKWCRDFFDTPIKELSQEDRLSQLKGAARIGAMILFFPVTAGVGFVYGISSGIDWFRGRRIEPNAPQFQEIDAEVQEVFNRIFSAMFSDDDVEKNFEGALQNYIVNNPKAIETLISHPASLVQLLPKMHLSLIDVCIEKIYENGNSNSFVGNLGQFIRDAVIKARTGTLTDEEKNFFMKELLTIIEKVEAKEGHKDYNLREDQESLLNAISKSWGHV